MKPNHQHQLNLKQNKMYIQSFPIPTNAILINEIGNQYYQNIPVSELAGYSFFQDEDSNWWLDNDTTFQQEPAPVELKFIIVGTTVIDISVSRNFRPNERPR